MVEPDAGADWSAILWREIMICVEAGMEREEVFVVAASSKVNKYARDNRPIRHLWADVLKAWNSKAAFATIAGELDYQLEFPILVTEDEYENLPQTFLDDYVEWGVEATDATPQYHELSGAILLSAILADGIHVKTSFGKIIPNLWGLILGESTLTRKTTAMRMAMDFVTELDSECLLATSGSVEGILTGLSERPNKVSMFFRDEVAGFFGEMQRKDYLSGMPEALAHLYDCPPMDHRRLRKETITIVSPVFIFFGGGIRDRVYETVREDLFYSGFLPRFLIVSGEADMERVRPMGPPSSDTKHAQRREDLRIRLADLKELYSRTVMFKVGSQTTQIDKNIEAILTPEAWERVAQIETTLTHIANESVNPLITLPTFVRLSTSLLKLGILIAASRQEPGGDYKIKVEERDIIHSAKYVQRWGVHTAHMLGNTGKTFTERTIDKILRCVREYPGITRSDVMRRHHLTSQEGNLLFSTLDDRGLITMSKEGRGYRVYPV
jgi:DNA-binding TFAR19-related protein (PDSD5 family)